MNLAYFSNSKNFKKSWSDIEARPFYFIKFTFQIQNLKFYEL